MKFNVGQVVYILSKKETKVFPAIVIEEICRKTIEEESTSYVVRLPDKGKSEVSTEDIAGDIFISLKDTENKMKSSADKEITRILDAAKKMESIFESDIKKNVDQVPNQEGDDIAVDLGNGIIANFNPEELSV